MLWLGEIANFTLILAFVLSFFISVLVFTNINLDFKAQIASFLFKNLIFFLSASQVFLAAAFLLDDFSIEYVAENSSSLLNWYYKISAIWGGHQGSLVFWIFLVALVGWVFSLNFHKKFAKNFLIQSLSIISFVIFGFLAYAIFLGNPFAKFFPFIPFEGADLNPMLQDLGLIFHPPLLYLGYAGLVLSFAFSASLLLDKGEFRKIGLKKLQNALRFSWIFLTLGILLGSFWAYYELGWGGWWFWDQVENSALIPWILLTFTLHSGNLALKRQSLFQLHIFFVILAFITSLLGNFLVRSGILSSVHSFATSPTKGKFILFLIFLISTGALVLFLLKSNKENKNIANLKTKSTFESDKKSLLNLQTIVFFSLGIMAILAASVALGTWYPIILQVFNLGDISVGAPYFNSFFVPLTLLLAFLLGLGFFLKTYKDLLKNIKKIHLYFAIFALSASGFFTEFIWLEKPKVLLALSLSLVAWILFVLILEFLNKIISAKKSANLTLSFYLQNALKFFAQHLAHLGFAFAVLGASVSSLAGDSEDIAIQKNQKIEKLGFVFILKNLEQKRKQNYIAEIAQIEILQNSTQIGVLKPERRLYFSSSMPMVETAINRNLWRDIYLALGDKLSNNVQALRIEYKPMISFLWLGAIFMALGGFFALTKKFFNQSIGK